MLIGLRLFREWGRRMDQRRLLVAVKNGLIVTADFYWSVPGRTNQSPTRCSFLPTEVFTHCLHH